jgi:hypothetical protein
MPGRHQSESVADIASERPAEIIGMLEGSVQSRVTGTADRALADMRDCTEA